MNSLIVEVAIGLVFSFAVFAALTSTLTEAIARFLRLRADYLLRGVRALVDGDVDGVPTRNDLQRILPPGELGKAGRMLRAADVLRNPLIASYGQPGLMLSKTAKPTRRQRRDLPGYLPSRTFARALIATLAPDAHGKTSLEEVDSAIDKLEPGVLRESLRTLSANAENSMQAFRESIEDWYDDHMDRVSGWYKRHVRWISLAIGALLVLAFNANAIAITRALYTDQALRESVVAQAVGTSKCEDKQPADCLRDVRKEIQGLHAVGLPLGWYADPTCRTAGTTTGDTCSLPVRYGLAARTGGAGAQFGFTLVLLLGYALMVFALLPGARFWFDLLGRLGSLRSSGPKPAKP